MHPPKGKLRLRATAAAMMLALRAGPIWAAGDAEAEAREHHERAVERYLAGDYPAALAELSRAAELRPSYKLWYNIGQVRAAMHDYAGAVGAYQLYLARGGSKISPERGRRVGEALAALERHVARLRVQCDVAGARVLVDGVPSGNTPLDAALLVNAGAREISLRHPEHPVQTRRLTLAGGSVEHVEFVLRRAPEDAPAAGERGAGARGSGARPRASKTALPRLSRGDAAATSASERAGTADPQSRASGPTRDVPWLAWAATGALGAGALVTGVWALSKNASLDDQRARGDVSEARLDASASELRTLSLVTDGLWLATVAAGGVSLWLTLADGADDESAPGVTAESGPDLRLGFAGNAISLSGAF